MSAAPWEQLAFAGEVIPAPLPMANILPTVHAARDAALEALEEAEEALLDEADRPVSREHWARMAACLDGRAAAWMALARTCERTCPVTPPARWSWLGLLTGSGPTA